MAPRIHVTAVSVRGIAAASSTTAGASPQTPPGTPARSGSRKKIIPYLFDFMGRRLFGPDRLSLLKAELAKSAAADWQEHDNEERKLAQEAEQLQRAIYRQTLRLEEHDDPRHPVIAAATRRIEELGSRHAAIEDALKTIRSQRPTDTHPDEILAMLDAIPDLRPMLRTAAPSELTDIYSAFQISTTYDKPRKTLEISATVRPDMLTKDETPTDETTERSGYSYIYSGGTIRSYRRPCCPSGTGFPRLAWTVARARAMAAGSAIARMPCRAGGCAG